MSGPSWLKVLRRDKRAIFTAAAKAQAAADWMHTQGAADQLKEVEQDGRLEGRRGRPTSPSPAV